MLKISSFLAVVVGLLVAATGVNAAPMYKCKLNGTITYQQDPCPTGQVRKPPTVQELNAAEKKRREAEAVKAATSEKPESPAVAQEKTTVNLQSPEKLKPFTANRPATPASSRNFSCDGRRYCKQMTSCAEAEYFLANCPGVKMDGDKDGIPCEEQWCTR
jgi:Excalibur calcium-binding domain